jgi:HK97 family phage portal protein
MKNALDLLAEDSTRSLRVELGLGNHKRGSTIESFHAESDRAGILFQQPTASGVEVNAETAMRVSAVNACVGVISSSLACMPLQLMKRVGKNTEAATEHPLYYLLHDAPNDLQTSIEFRELMQARVCLRGNSYARVSRNGAGVVVQLDPLHPDRIAVFENGGKPFYAYTHRDGSREILNSDEMLHIRGLGPDGLMGYSPITLAREAVGLSMATEAHGARFFGNGARPGGVLEAPSNLSPEQLKKIKTDWEQAHSGKNQNSVGVLFGGMKYNAITMNNDDAQFLETRQFQVTDIARIFRVPPHKIADLSKATFSNIEHQAIEFVTDCMMPHIVRWEQRMNRVLLTPSERRQFFFKFNIDALVRGDLKTRFEAYRVGREGGWMSVNDIRDLEDKNRVEGGDGYLQPLNFTKLGGETLPSGEPSADDPKGARPAKAPATSPDDEEARSAAPVINLSVQVQPQQATKLNITRDQKTGALTATSEPIS